MKKTMAKKRVKNKEDSVQKERKRVVRTTMKMTVRKKVKKTGKTELNDRETEEEKKIKINFILFFFYLKRKRRKEQ
jgi:hypothetical protein